MPRTAGDAPDRRSLHERIAADLRDEIMCGDLPPGAKLPSTAQLKDTFSASNATVQKALQLLKDEHLVVGRAGAAVTVRDHKQQTVRPAASAVRGTGGAPYPWLAPAKAHGLEVRSTLLDVCETVPPADVAAALDLPEAGGAAVRRRQILSAGEEPLELVHSYYPPDIARGTPLAGRRRIKGGASALLTQLGHPLVRCVDLVSARVPTQEQYEALRLPGHLPVLRTLRIAYGPRDRPVEVTVMTKAGHLYELQYEFSPEDGSQPAGTGAATGDQKG